jgi:hypothetical protein
MRRFNRDFGTTVSGRHARSAHRRRCDRVVEMVDGRIARDERR